jgi:hypothetical protein
MAPSRRWVRCYQFVVELAFVSSKASIAGHEMCSGLSKANTF